MTLIIKDFIEENIDRFSEKLGYNKCRISNFDWIIDFEKFINIHFKLNKNLLIILPASRDDKEELANIIRKTAYKNNGLVMIIYSERLPVKNFIICYK